ncbi:MAG: hypothetical protein CV081_08260 [Nitrospira sp. LK265]|nr:hypothetical protein [Nitrospira sp. LK265]
MGKILLLLSPKKGGNGRSMEIKIGVVARGRSFMLDGGRCAGLKRRGGIGMANKKKKTVAKKSSRAKKAAPSPKKAVKKTVKKRAAVKAAKSALKKKTTKKAAGKAAKKAAPKASPPSASAKQLVDEEDVAPRKPVAVKPTMPMEPGEADLDDEDEIVSDDLEMEGEIEEDDVQEELDLDADDDGDALIDKSEDLLDDDYRHN